MTAPIDKSVRIVGPTGASSPLKRVNILKAFTGPTGHIPIYSQLSAAQAKVGTHVTYIDATGATGAAHNSFKTIIIPGYTGPA